jgi:hypothetical protein
MTPDWIWALVVPLVAVVGLSLFAWTQSRSETLLRQCAARNGYRLLNFERRTLFRGPFFLLTSQRQTVYHVTVQTSDGQTRHAYTRLGGWFTGLLSDDVDVEWDD